MMMEEYLRWLEKQIETCLNDNDLQREHWAFCRAYENAIKFVAKAEQLEGLLEDLKYETDKGELLEGLARTQKKELEALREKAKQLESDKARLLEALKNTDSRMMRASQWVGTSGLNASIDTQAEYNTQLITEMEV